MAEELAARGIDAMTLDHMGEAWQLRDRQILNAAFREFQVHYQHAQPHSAEPLLWIPDGIAWAAGRGGEWRRRIDDWVTIKQL